VELNCRLNYGRDVTRKLIGSRGFIGIINHQELTAVVLFVRQRTVFG